MTKGQKDFYFVRVWKITRDSMKELALNDPLRMAGATAFFTTFALPPILIILIQVFGLILNPEKISQQLFKNLSGIIGRQSVQQVVDVLEAFTQLAKNWYVTLGGFIFLLFVATTLFRVIKNSLNQLWKIKVIKKRSVWLVVRTRLQSILVILVAGLLFLIGLLAEGAQAFLGNYLDEMAPEIAGYLNSVVNYIVSIVIVTLWFAILFRYLPDGRPQWKVALAGGLLTSLLFNSGKFILRWLLTYSNIDTIYGASGSIVLLLLFVFYSSLILYFGAAFTKIWGARHNDPIRTLPHAVHYKLTETEDV